MGVPAFYRWLSSRYPKCVVLCEEDEPYEVDGVEIPVDCTRDSPNGHVDNLYLDMNGIIHPCFHPENQPAPMTFDECFKAIFEYIDRIMAIVRPRKLLYMAIDGVAPRAKMNQQRSRRFKTAKESKDKVQEEKKIRAELRAEGLNVREEGVLTETTELSDSNIITPGTAFMAKLSVALQYYIHQRINSAPAWKTIAVILSDSNVPGEGEHKIMEFIREQRGRPGYNPNMTHVVSGLDADLIHLALATHEPKFHILREVLFGAPAGDDPEGGAKPKVPYQYLKISILREYLALEFIDVNLPFPFDKERIFDDFVFLCFFVGNDFLPHSPTLEIREGGIDLLMSIYRRQLPHLGGWLCDGATVNLKRVEAIVREVSRCEEQILQKRMRLLKNQESKRKSAMKRPLRLTPGSSPSPMPSMEPATADVETSSKETPKKQKIKEDTLRAATTARTEQVSMSVDSQKVWHDLMSVSPDQKQKFLLPTESEEDIAREREEQEEAERIVKERVKTSRHEKADMFDSMLEHGETVGFGSAGWKDRYYRMKFPDVEDSERNGLVKDMATKFVEGLLWVMAYYYEGVASWTWYYPYHYAPFASDMVRIANIKPNFQLGEPFLPVNQLMAVLPAASRFCLPQPLQHLFVDQDSPIVDFYPDDFKCDMNGKRFSWQAVVLLPFIDEKILVATTKEYFDEFNDEEKERNKRKLTQFYVGDKHPLGSIINSFMDAKTETQTAKLELDAEKSDELNGTLFLTEKYRPDTISAPFDIGADITDNRVCMASFSNPSHQRHLCSLMTGAKEAELGLTMQDIPPEQEAWHQHPRAGHNPPSAYSTPRPKFSIDRDAAHRFVVHQVAQPRLRDDPRTPFPYSAPPQPRSTLRASAPEFVPDNVTQMALQMTGQVAPHPFIRPPLIPPEDVTNAAIRLAQRVQHPSIAVPQNPVQLFNAQNLLLIQQQNQALQQQQLLGQMQGAFPPSMGGRPYAPGMQPQIQTPMFSTVQPPSSLRPPMLGTDLNSHSSAQADHQRKQRFNRRQGDRQSREHQGKRRP